MAGHFILAGDVPMRWHLSRVFCWGGRALSSLSWYSFRTWYELFLFTTNYFLIIIVTIIVGTWNYRRVCLICVLQDTDQGKMVTTTECTFIMRNLRTGVMSQLLSTCLPKTIVTAADLESITIPIQIIIITTITHHWKWSNKLNCFRPVTTRPLRTIRVMMELMLYVL